MNTILNNELLENYRKEVYKKVKTTKIRNYYEKCLKNLNNYNCSDTNIFSIIDSFLINELNITNVNNISMKNRNNYEKTCFRCLFTLKEYIKTGNFKKFITYRKDYVYLIENEVFTSNNVSNLVNILHQVYESQKERSNKITFYEYCRFWYKFYNYLINNKKDFTIDESDNFLKLYMNEIPKEIKDLTYTQRTVLRAITILKVKYENINYENIRYDKLQYHYKILDEYEKYLNECNLSWKTIQTRILFSRRFLTYIFDNNIEIKNITIDIVNNYFNKYSYYKDKRGLYSTTKLFLKYLFNNNVLSVPLHLKIFNYRMPYPSTIPSVWSEENINKLLNVIDRNTSIGKRNYAILLISTKLGLRAVDIFNLKFSNINWSNNYIEFNQSKTNGYVKLPLLNSVGNAIIDYLKDGRPNCDLDYIFLRHKKPYKKLVTLYATIEKYIKNSDIKFECAQKKGMHSFRHTVGSNLLNKNIPINTIAPILGHSNSNSTTIYLKCDKEKLKTCFISIEKEVNHV